MLPVRGAQAIILLVCLQICSATNDKFTVVTQETITANVGEDVVLQAHLMPKIDAVGMIVLWTDQADHEIHSYTKQTENTDHQPDAYKDRVSLFKEELERGNVSLKLTKVQVSDAGTYRCSVTSMTWESEAVIKLEVIGIGNPPLVSLAAPHDGIRFTCVSGGWYPRPVLLWMDENGADLTSSAQTTEKNDTNSLFTLISHLDISSQSGYHACILRQTEANTQLESKIQVSAAHFLRVSSSWKHGGIFLILFVLGLMAVTTVLVLRNRRASATLKKERAEKRTIKEECRHLKGEAEEKKKLEKDCDELREDLKSRGYLLKSEWKGIQMNAVDVTLDPDSAHPELILSEDGKSVERGETRQDYPDTAKRFERWFAVVGRQGFDSGKHYWEVYIRDEKNAGAQWRLGVVCESAERKGAVTVNPKFGYWLLESSKHFKALSVPETVISLRPVPQRVGLYLDYEGGQLSFYGVEDRRHLHTFRHKFTERLYPLFYSQTNDVIIEIVSPITEEHDGDTPESKSHPPQGPFCDTV
ncbi:butyrophilin subfamily 2 member A2-like [Megalops cyprinoides]|uniref:butyrophilin subfamily 2 member A2-like n=1 Tax=Megalops cyprinoides TaxID=118141 RepID=UPI001864AA33|nr:butyrophilin subfamily 2 member A2-like [Megalops cyprinoides]XP_036404163.1 butyrophilin subfamily 2 member A2-like [Megalops cyprinoides]XP_036404164.1 butyrophilin subfamily 2 member A2-like [Megalops cyprinoides]XP_036404165.1 butyrophilin subfamily 2 member A2-like [Megalops cyprinoides]